MNDAAPNSENESKLFIFRLFPRKSLKFPLTLNLIILIIIAVLTGWLLMVKENQKVKPGFCLVLGDKYCKKAEIFDWTYQEKTYQIAGFRLPPDVPIFSPIDGKSGKPRPAESHDDNPFSAVPSILLSDSSLTNFDLYGDIGFSSMISYDVKKGEIIASSKNTGIKMFGDYNFVIRITRRSNEGGFMTDGILFKLFPQRAP